MSLNINIIKTCTDILECMMVEEDRYTTLEDDHISALSTYVIHGRQSTRAEVKKNDMLVLQR